MTIGTLCTALVVWSYLQPPLEQSIRFEFGWVLRMYLRNLGIMILIAGSLHLYFHKFKKQGDKRKFLAREFAENHRRFTFRDQVLDNMFWTLASGVTVWTGYEVLYMWAFANGYLPTLSWTDNPIWLTLLFLFTPMWTSFHFYWIHRLLHWSPLYKLAHSLHHRNINTGPWTGISMHPIEHALYFSSILIHLVIPSNPLLMFFHMHVQAINPLASHSGFDDLLINGTGRMSLGEFHHQLHHRYFECNYGTADVPWDKWFGSFHDGTVEATQRLNENRRNNR